MKKTLFVAVAAFFGCLAFAGTPEKMDADAFAAADWHWQPLGRGAEAGYAQLTLFGAVQHISVIKYKAKRFRTDIIDAPAAMSDSTEALARAHGAIAAINGSYFNMKTLVPTTYVKDAGRQCGWTTPRELYRVDGMMAVRHRKIEISLSDTTDYNSLARGRKEAMAAGPVLLIAGQEARSEWPLDKFYTKRHPRTLIGTTDDGWVYLIVIDGRFKGQGTGATIHETAMIAQLFGLKDVLNLDGGGSSTLWTKATGVLSHPYDNRRFDHYGQRAVPNIILIK
jgi:exopolysaccharide biosynthesis protein